MIDHAPPNNFELEQSILSSCLIDYEDEYDDLIPADFYTGVNKRIFKAIQSLRNDGEPIDANKVAVSVGEQDITAIKNLLDIPPVTDPPFYCRRLKDLSKLRRLLELSNAISKRVYSYTPDTTEEILNYALSEILRVGDGGKSGYRHISDLTLECLERCEELQQRGGITGVPSGLIDLDALTCGFQQSDLILLAARPGMGKTALAINLLLNGANRGHRGCLNSLEMAGAQVGNRFLSLKARINGMKFRSGNFDVQDFTQLQDAAAKLSELPIWIDDSPTATYQDLQKKLRRQYATEGVDLAIIDYLGFIDGDKDGGRVMEVQSISRALKATAKELNIPIILICQLSRACEQRPNKRPILSDLRDSGALEQDADIVMFLYREHVYDKEYDPTEAELCIAKQRNGPTGTIGLYWEDKFTGFQNAIR